MKKQLFAKKGIITGRNLMSCIAQAMNETFSDSGTLDIAEIVEDAHARAQAHMQDLAAQTEEEKAEYYANSRCNL